MAEVRPEAVLHFAAKSLVGESQVRPELYWEHNVGGSLALLEAIVDRLADVLLEMLHGQSSQVEVDEVLASALRLEVAEAEPRRDVVDHLLEDPAAAAAPVAPRRIVAAHRSISARFPRKDASVKHV